LQIIHKNIVEVSQLLILDIRINFTDFYLLNLYEYKLDDFKQRNQ